MHFSVLSKMSEIELVKLYRKETSQSAKSIIFKAILDSPRENGKSWRHNIMVHVQRSKYGLGYYDNCIEEDDLFQSVVIAFHKMVEKWFNPSTKYGFGTYAWYTINSYTDRIFQYLNNQKRFLPKSSMVNINEICKDNLCYGDLISKDGGAAIKPVFCEKSFEDEIMVRDVVNFIKEYFKPNYLKRKYFEQEGFDVQSTIDIQDDFLLAIKNMVVDEIYLKNLSEEYTISIERLKALRGEMEKLFKKCMYTDLLIFMEKDIKDYTALARKYNRPPSQIVQVRKSLSESARKKLKSVNLSINCFV